MRTSAVEEFAVFDRFLPTLTALGWALMFGWGVATAKVRPVVQTARITLRIAGVVVVGIAIEYLAFPPYLLPSTWSVSPLFVISTLVWMATCALLLFTWPNAKDADRPWLWPRLIPYRAKLWLWTLAWAAVSGLFALKYS